MNPTLKEAQIVADTDGIVQPNQNLPLSQLVSYSDGDYGDDCRMFEYSAESMQAATESEDPTKNTNEISFTNVNIGHKERNYRNKKDKTEGKSSPSRSRSRSRSKSRNRSRRGDKHKDQSKKRQEIQRYDVRTVIADGQPTAYKDKFRHNRSRPPSIVTPRFQGSVSPRRDKSRSYSRSISPGSISNKMKFEKSRLILNVFRFQIESLFGFQK